MISSSVTLGTPYMIFHRGLCVGFLFSLRLDTFEMYTLRKSTESVKISNSAHLEVEHAHLFQGCFILTQPTTLH